MEMLPPRRSGLSSPLGLSWPAGTDAEARGAGRARARGAGDHGAAQVAGLGSPGRLRIVVVFEEADDAGRGSNSRAGGAGRGSNSRGGWCRSSNVEGGRSRSNEVEGRRSGCGGGRTTMGRGRSVAATSGAQGRAPGVGADDGAAANGCGVCRASTSNPPATRGEEGRHVTYKEERKDTVISTLLLSECFTFYACRRADNPSNQVSRLDPNSWESSQRGQTIHPCSRHTSGRSNQINSRKVLKKNQIQIENQIQNHPKVSTGCTLLRDSHPRLRG